MPNRIRRNSVVDMIARVPVHRGSLLKSIENLLKTIESSENSVMIPTLLRDKVRVDAWELLFVAKILKASILGHSDLVEFYMNHIGHHHSTLQQQQTGGGGQAPQQQQQQVVDGAPPLLSPTLSHRQQPQQPSPLTNQQQTNGQSSSSPFSSAASSVSSNNTANGGGGATTTITSNQSRSTASWITASQQQQTNSSSTLSSSSFVSNLSGADLDQNNQTTVESSNTNSRTTNTANSAATTPTNQPPPPQPPTSLAVSGELPSAPEAARPLLVRQAQPPSLLQLTTTNNHINSMAASFANFSLEQLSNQLGALSPNGTTTNSLANGCLEGGVGVGPTLSISTAQQADNNSSSGNTLSAPNNSRQLGPQQAELRTSRSAGCLFRGANSINSSGGGGNTYSGASSPRTPAQTPTTPYPQAETLANGQASGLVGDPSAPVKLLLQIEQLKVSISHVTTLLESVVELYKHSIDNIAQ